MKKLAQVQQAQNELLSGKFPEEILMNEISKEDREKALTKIYTTNDEFKKLKRNRVEKDYMTLRLQIMMKFSGYADIKFTFQTLGKILIVLGILTTILAAAGLNGNLVNGLITVLSGSGLFVLGTNAYYKDSLLLGITLGYFGVLIVEFVITGVPDTFVPYGVLMNYTGTWVTILKGLIGLTPYLFIGTKLVIGFFVAAQIQKRNDFLSLREKFNSTEVPSSFVNNAEKVQ